MNSADVYLSIGSNMGDRLANCERALRELLADNLSSLVNRSSWYETEPWGKENQNWFINGVVQIKTSLAPHELLPVCKAIEQRLGRVKNSRWGPRSIDIDILLYDRCIMKSADLEIPHPRLHERTFVLIPLSEIAPQVVHPVLQKTVRELLASSKDTKQVIKIVE